MTAQEFKIIRGVMPLPNYTDSPEKDIVVLDILSGGIGTADSVQYSPNNPQTKNGGVWADSSLSDGRQPLSLAYGNIVETVTFKVSASTFKELNQKLKEIKLFIADCKRFGTGHSFIEPVYLHYRQTNEVPAQFALLFNIDSEISYLDKSAEDLVSIASITISWEREYGWRAIPPGTSPVYYAQLAGGNIPGQDFGYTDLDPLSSNSLIYETAFTNRLEYDFGAGQDSPTITENYITIPKEDIPGDLPALCMIDMGVSAGVGTILKELYVGHSVTPRLPVPTSYTDDFNDNYVFAGGDINDIAGNPDFVTTYLTGQGVISNSSTVTKHVLNVAFVAGALTGGQVGSWGEGNGGSASNVDYKIRLNSYIGKYSVYMRHDLTAGVSTDIDLFLRISAIGDYDNFIDTQSINPASTTAPADRFPFAYMGNISLPIGERAKSASDGVGLYNIDGGDFKIELRYNDRSAGGAVTVNICDIILVPYDIAMFKAVLPANGVVEQVTVDGTGYLGHGGVLSKSRFKNTTGGTKISSANIVGVVPQLIPGVDNRLHIIYAYEDTGGGLLSDTDPTDPLALAVNIIPRWSGNRDE